ncbi:MAG: hypothetical protein HYS06_10375 [Methylocystis sp.]|nr:hypothetical protein [Methylocystis sp.]
MTGEPDGVTNIGPGAERFGPIAAFLEAKPDLHAFERLRRANSIGRPFGGRDLSREPGANRPAASSAPANAA